MSEQKKDRKKKKSKYEKRIKIDSVGSFEDALLKMMKYKPKKKKGE